MTVNLFANNLANIDHLSKVSFGHALKFSKRNKVAASIQNIIANSLTPQEVENNLEQIAKQLDSINNSVQQYTKTTPWYKKCFHWINHLKVRSLRRSLPKLIDAVNQQAMAHFKIDPNDVAGSDSDLALMIPSTTSSYLASYYKIKVFIQNNTYTVPPTGNPPPSSSGDNPLPPQVKRITSNIIPSKPSGLSKIAEKKWQVLEKVQKLFQARNPDKNSWDQTARMMNDYIVGKFQTLAKDKDVTIPRFFHCTQPGTWPLIVKSKSILQQQAPLGNGAFISNQDESNSRYGTHTFALTEESVFNFTGYYYDGISCGGTQGSLWVCIDNNIPVNNGTIAHLVVPTVNDIETVGLQVCTDLNLLVPVITREASVALNLLFREAMVSYDLPKTWKIHSSYNHQVVINKLPYPVKT